MKEENTNGLPMKLNLPPEQLTEPVIKSYFLKEISRKDYQQALQGIENLKPAKDNLPQVNKKVKEANRVLGELNEFAKDVGTPYHKAHKNILAAMKAFVDPISTNIKIVEAAVKTVNDELLADLAKEEAERQRIEHIKRTMAEFINNCITFIGTATTDKQIVNIQKRIGTEKSKKGFYAEFYDEFVGKCAALDPLINERKEIIRKAAELSAAAETALKNDDADAAAEIKEQQEQLESDMEENILRLQDAAFEQISNEIPTIVPENTNEALQGRNYWRWEVTDIKKLHQKTPEFVILEPNKEMLDKYMAENREQWKADGKKEVVIPGIKFFIKKFL